MVNPYAFPRCEHLTKRAEYLSVYDRGSKWVGRMFILYVVRDEGAERKLGVAVTRKVGNAVVRNRVKRILREIYRHHRPHLGTGFRMVLVARPYAAQASYDECHAAVAGLFKQGGVLSE